LENLAKKTYFYTQDHINDYLFHVSINGVLEIIIVNHINDYLFHVSINGVLEIIIVKILKLKNK
jgi:hypothetical protein